LLTSNNKDHRQGRPIGLWWGENLKINTQLFAITGLLIFSFTSMAATSRIIGGTEVTEPNQDANYPWITSLYFDGFFSCGASLIAPQWVLTAAHCVVDDESGVTLAASDFAVGVNDYSLLSEVDDEYITVTEVYVAAGYDDITLDSDIAILKLAVPATATPINLIETPAFNDLADGTRLTIMGWGNTVVDDTDGYPARLREASVTLANYQTCAGDYAATGQALTGNMFCAGGNGVTDTCQGDSGGPIVRFIEGEYQQVGIVSWGGIENQSCAAEGYPGVYTRLSKYTPWIESVLAGNEIQDFSPENEVIINNPNQGSNRKKSSVGSMGFALLLLFPILLLGRKVKLEKRD